MGPAAVPVSVVRAVRDAGSARQSGATPHFHFGFGLSEIIHQHSCLISQSRQSKQPWHSSVSHGSQSSRGTWSSRCMQRRRHTLRTTDTPTHHAQWEAIAHDRPSHPPQTPRRTDGGRHNPTHTGAAQTPYTSALARCGRRSPLFYRLFNGGVRPRAAPSRSRRETSEPHAMRACAMAPLAPCLRQID